MFVNKPIRKLPFPAKACDISLILSPVAFSNASAILQSGKQGEISAVESGNSVGDQQYVCNHCSFGAKNWDRMIVWVMGFLRSLTNVSFTMRGSVVILE